MGLPENDRDWMGACDAVLRNIIIASDLSVHICCGIAKTTTPELSIGSLTEDDLIAILQRGNQDLIANWLALEGPSLILNFARPQDPSIKLPKHYVNKCHLCNELFTREDVRRVLAEHAGKRAQDLMLMRSALDWISEDWPRASIPSPPVSLRDVPLISQTER
jgi:hypothetical protein